MQPVAFAVILFAAVDPGSLYPGDLLTVRIGQELNSGRHEAGTRFQGVLEAPVVVGGRQLAPKGAAVEGYIRQASTSGRWNGRSELHLHLDRLTIGGRRYSITTLPEVRTGPSHQRHNAKYMGGGVLLGTLIGAFAGGGKGAAAGAAGGALAGAAGAAVTGKKEILIPAETVLTFRLRDRVILD